MIAFSLILRRILDGEGLWLTLGATTVAVSALAIALSGTRPLKPLALGAVVSAGLLILASAH